MSTGVKFLERMPRGRLNISFHKRLRVAAQDAFWWCLISLIVLIVSALAMAVLCVSSVLTAARHITPWWAALRYRAIRERMPAICPSSERTRR